MQKSISLTSLCFVAAVLGSTTAHAFQFTPSEAEWQSWPGYCKAKYVWSNVGKQSIFANRAEPAHKAELARWEAAGIRNLHHYCAGSLYLRRASVASDPVKRGYNLRAAFDETHFSYSSANPASPLFGHLVVQLATILYEQGEYQRALETLSASLASQPRNAMIYSAVAVMQRKLGHLDEAKQTLLRGKESIGGESAEIDYNLGLISLEQGDLDSAVRYAQSAYSQGFPLRGLRAKLEDLGRM